MHRLMSEPLIYIDGISGTSAGAMNAVVFADGFLKGRRQGAIDGLEQFWGSVADLAGMPRSIMRGIPGISDGWAVDNDPAFMMLDIMTRIWSPAQLNPMKVNPLRDLLEKQVDFERPARAAGREAVRHRLQRAHLQVAPVPHAGAHRRYADGLGLPAVPVRGGGDRRRVLLGRRLSRQSGDLSADPRMLVERRGDRADQPADPQRGAGRPRATSSTASTR